MHDDDDDAADKQAPAVFGATSFALRVASFPHRVLGAAKRGLGGVEVSVRENRMKEGLQAHDQRHKAKETTGPPADDNSVKEPLGAETARGG